MGVDDAYSEQRGDDAGKQGPCGRDRKAETVMQRGNHTSLFKANISLNG